MLRFTTTLISAAILFLVVACNTTISRHQQSELEKRASHLVKGIISVVGEIKRPLFVSYQQAGGWSGENQNYSGFTNRVSEELASHDMQFLRMVPIDNEEILIELGLENKSVTQFPQLLNSWLLIFSCQSQKQTADLISLVPVWKEPDVISAHSKFTSQQIEKFQDEFKKIVNDKLILEVLELSTNKS